MTQNKKEQGLYNVIIPIAEKDVDIVKINLEYIKKNISPRKIVIIANNKIKNYFVNEEVDFLDENEVIEGLNFARIYEILKKKSAEKRTGWYFQQFLKYAYANLCEEEYYITWDADTIPIRKINFFNENNKFIFSLKSEFNKPYFDTIEKLFGYEKVIKESFIAEHMVFKKKYVLELINKISGLDESHLWFETILESIKEEDIAKAGFSEFETYGTFVYRNYPDSYCTREIKALRNGQIIFNDCPEADVLEWISKKYETISFEKSQNSILHFNIYKNKLFRELFSINGYLFMFKVLKRIKR